MGVYHHHLHTIITIVVNIYKSWIHLTFTLLAGTSTGIGKLYCRRAFCVPVSVQHTSFSKFGRQVTNSSDTILPKFLKRYWLQALVPPSVIYVIILSLLSTTILNCKAVTRFGIYIDRFTKFCHFSHGSFTVASRRVLHKIWSFFF